MHQVEAAELVDGGGDDPPPSVRVTDVGRDVLPADLRRERFARVVGEVDHDDRRAFAGQPAHRRRTDARRASRDHCDLAVERSHRGDASFRPLSDPGDSPANWERGMGKLDGKVAIVTGAARGQGEAEAREFVAEGAKVVLGDVLDDLGEKVAADLGDDAVYVHLDVTNPADWTGAVDTAVATFGKLDVLINNAGIIKVGMIESFALDDYMAVVNVNQVGCFLGMQAVIPALKASGGGSIVNTSSTSGFVGTVGLVAYTASKFAVRGMTKVAAMELGHSNIRVNSVHPGGVDTEMVRLPEFGDVPTEDVWAAQPIPRVGRPEEIAKMMVFLASDDSSFSTGAEFIADGGFTCGPPLTGIGD